MSASSKAGIPKSKIWGRDRRPQPPGLTHMGPSIKYITLFLANFDLPSPCHTLPHIPGPPESTSHISDPPPIFSRPSTNISDKSPRYKFYINCPPRFLYGGFV